MVRSGLILEKINSNSDMSEQETNGRVYELGYLLVPTVAEGQIPEALGEIKKILEKNGATVVSEGAPEFIDLAYEMEHIVGSARSRYTQAYFGWVKFEAGPETMELLKKAFDGLATVIRYLLVKTDKANTVVFKKPKGTLRRESVGAEEVTPEEGVVAEEAVEEHEKLPELEEEVEVAVVAAEEKEEKEA